MNIERLKRVRQLIIDNPESFDYRHWFKCPKYNNEPSMIVATELYNHECGTTGCIAGWCTAIAVVEEPALVERFPYTLGHLKSINTRATAMNWLACYEHEIIYALFEGYESKLLELPKLRLDAITVKEAVHRIDCVIAYFDPEYTISC